MSDTARIAIGVSIEHMDAITDLSTSLDTLTVAYSKFLRVNQEFRANSDMSRVFGNLGDATDETRVRIINLARNLSVLDDAFNASSGASGKLMSSFGDNEKIIKEIGLAMANMAAQFTKGMTVNSQEITGFTGEYSQFLKKLQAMTGVSADNIEQTIAGMLGSPQHFQALLANMGAMVKLAQKFRAGAPKDVTKTSGLGQWNTAGAKAFKAAEVGAPMDFSNFLRESKSKGGNMGNPGDAANRALAESMASVHVYKSEIEAFANDGQQAVLRFTDAWELSAGEVVDSAVKAASKVLEESNALKEFAGTATKTGNAVEQAAATVQEASVEQSQAVEKAADAATQATVGQSQAVEKAANTATQAAAEETKAVEKAADAVEEAVDNTVKAQKKSSRSHPLEGVRGEIISIVTLLKFFSYSQVGNAIIPALRGIEDILNEIATSAVPKLIEAFSRVNVTVNASVESTAKAAESGAKAVEASAQRQVAAADKVAKSMISDQQLYAQRYAEIDDRINSLIAHRATISGKGSKAAKQAVDDEIASLRQLRGEYQSLEAAGTPIANVAYDLQTRRVQQLPDQSTDRGRIQAYNQQVDLGASLSQGLSTTQARTDALNASIGQSMESTASTVQETANEVVQSAEKTQEAAADAADSVHTTALTEQEAREKESEKAKEALLERLKIYKTDSTALERLKQYVSDIIPTDISGMVRNPLSGGVGFRGNGASVSVGGWDPRQKLVPTPGTPGYQSLFFSFKGDNPPGTELATFPGTFKASYPPGTAGVSRTNPNRKLEETLIERVIAELSPGASVSADALSTISVDKVLNDAAKSVQRVAAREAATAASKASEGVTSGLAAIDAAASNARKKSMQDEAEAAAKRARYSESYLQDLFAISESSLDIVNIYRLADAILQKIASGISVSADEMRTLDMLTEALDGTVEGLNGDFEVTRRTLVEMANARRAAERTIGAASPSMVTFPWENVASASPGRDGRPVMRTAPESQRTTPYGPSGNQIQFSPREIHAIRQQEYNQIFDAIETRSDEFMAKMDNVKRFVTANFKMIAMSISMPIKDAAGYVANGAREISSAVISAGSAIGKGMMKPLLGLKSLSKAVFSGLIEGFRQEVESIKRLSIGERIRDQERALDAVFRAGFRLKMVGMDMQYFGRRVTGVIDEFIGLYGNFELTTMRAAAALGGFGIALKDSTLDQEQKIAKIDENFTSLKESILDATESIAFFTSDEVAKGLYFYASTVGQNVSEVDGLRDAMAALEPMMKVASITGTGYESVIKGVYSVVSQFNSELVTSAKITGDYTALTSRMADVTEKLYYVSNATASEFPDLVNAFKMVGPVAKQSGASFEDMVDVLGRLADIGIKGTMAGRGMRQMFIQMSRPTPKAKKAIEDLFKQMSTPDVGSATRLGRPAVAPQFAGKTYEDVFFPGGKFQGVDTYINSLAEALQYADDATKNFTLSSISTANELPIITALVNDQINVLNGLGDVNKEVGKLSEGSTGKIQEQWSAIEKSVSYAMSRMDRTFETLKITIGDSVSKGLLPFINQLSDGIKQIREWVNNNKELVKNVGTAIGVIGGLSVAFGSLLMVMGSLVGLVAAAKLVFTAFFPVFGILGGAIGGVIAFAIILTQRFDEIQRAAQKLQQNFVNVSGSLQQNSSAIFDMLKDAFQPLLYIGNSLVDLLLSIIKALTSATNSVDSTTSSFSALGLVLKLIATYFSVSLIYNVLKFFKIVSIGKTIFKGVFDAAGAAIKAFMAGTVKASFAATLSMQSLKAGVISLGAGLKAAFLSNPVGILLVAITTFAEFAMPFFDSLNKSTQKFRDNLKQTADGFGNLAVAAENSALKVGNAYAEIALRESGKGPIGFNLNAESLNEAFVNVGPEQTPRQKQEFNAKAGEVFKGQMTLKDPATGEILSKAYYDMNAVIAAIDNMPGITDPQKKKYKSAVRNWFEKHNDEIQQVNKEAWENLGTKAGHIFLEQVKVESEKFNSDMTSQLGVGEIDYTEMYNRIALTVANRMPFAGDAILTITNEIAKQAAMSGGVITPQKLEEIITTIIGNSDWRAAWNAGGYQLSLEDITAQLGLKSVGQAAFDKNKTFLSQKASMLDYMSSIGEQIKSGQLSQDEVKKLLISSNVPGEIVASSMGISLRTTIALNQWVDENRDNPDVAAANEDLYTIIGQMYPDIALDDNADEAVSAWLVPIESAFKSLNASLKSINFQKKLENIIAISDPYNALAEVFSQLAKSRTTTAMVNMPSTISSWMVGSGSMSGQTTMTNRLVEQVLIKGEQTDEEYKSALAQGRIELLDISRRIKDGGLLFDDEVNKQLLDAAKAIAEGMDDPEFYTQMEAIFGSSADKASDNIKSALDTLREKFSSMADEFKNKRLNIDAITSDIGKILSGQISSNGIVYKTLNQGQIDKAFGSYLASLTQEQRDTIGATEEFINEYIANSADFRVGWNQGISAGIEQATLTRDDIVNGIDFLNNVWQGKSVKPEDTNSTLIDFLNNVWQDIPVEGAKALIENKFQQISQVVMTLEEKTAEASSLLEKAIKNLKLAKFGTAGLDAIIKILRGSNDISSTMSSWLMGETSDIDYKLLAKEMKKWTQETLDFWGITKEDIDSLIRFSPEFAKEWGPPNTQYDKGQSFVRPAVEFTNGIAYQVGDLEKAMLRIEGIITSTDSPGTFLGKIAMWLFVGSKPNPDWASHYASFSQRQKDFVDSINFLNTAWGRILTGWEIHLRGMEGLASDAKKRKDFMSVLTQSTTSFMPPPSTLKEVRDRLDEYGRRLLSGALSSGPGKTGWDQGKINDYWEGVFARIFDQKTVNDAAISQGENLINAVRTQTLRNGDFIPNLITNVMNSVDSRNPMSAAQAMNRIADALALYIPDGSTLTLKELWNRGEDLGKYISEEGQAALAQSFFDTQVDIGRWKPAETPAEKMSRELINDTISSVYESLTDRKTWRDAITTANKRGSVVSNVREVLKSARGLSGLVRNQAGSMAAFTDPIIGMMNSLLPFMQFKDKNVQGMILKVIKGQLRGQKPIVRKLIKSALQSWVSQGIITPEQLYKIFPELRPKGGDTVTPVEEDFAGGMFSDPIINALLNAQSNTTVITTARNLGEVMASEVVKGFGGVFATDASFLPLPPRWLHNERPGPLDFPYNNGIDVGVYKYDVASGTLVNQNSTNPGKNPPARPVVRPIIKPSYHFKPKNIDAIDSVLSPKNSRTVKSEYHFKPQNLDIIDKTPLNNAWKGNAKNRGMMAGHRNAFIIPVVMHIPDSNKASIMSTLSKWSDKIKAGATALGTAWGIEFDKAAVDGVNNALLIMKASLVGNSPPKKGPLRTIDKGGHNIGKSWGGAFHAAAVDSIHRGAQEVRRTLDAQNNEFANRGSMDMSINRNDKKHIQISLNVTGDGSANRATMSELRKGLMDALIMADLEHMVEVI
jgi:TP901 family phage tail tape measure protein